MMVQKGQTQNTGSVTAASSPLRAAPFVGRDEQLTCVMNCYAAARQGQAHVVLLAGEPGIGKTRLLDEIAVRAAHDGAIVLRGGASEAEGMPPYLPFLEALGPYIQEVCLDQLREQVTAASPLLASIFPELHTRLGDLPSPHPLPVEQARFRLYEAVGTFLQGIGRSQALVLLFDDLHWADAASFDLLCHIARRQSHAHLLIVGAYRASELDHNAALTRTITELSQRRMLVTVAIEPLSYQEIEALAFHSLGSPLSSVVSSLLYAQSEGNPFFAEELLHNWIETGAIILKHQQWVAVAPLEQTLPPSIVGALRQRFARFSTALIDDLRIAAIIGRTFDSSLLAAIQQKESEAVEQWLFEAVGAHLLQANREGTFTFSHDKIRECLSAEVSMSRRRRLHGMIGHLLEERSVQEETRQHVYQLAELAFHFTHSDDRARGIDYSQRAAEQALQAFAVQEALSHYRMVLTLLQPDDRRYGELLLTVGEVALLAGREGEAEHLYEAAQRWFAAEKDREALAQAAYGLGRAYWRQDKRAEARAAFEQAIALLANQQGAELVKVLADVSVLLTVYLGEPKEGMAYAQQALELAQALGDVDLETRTQRVVASNLASLRSSDLRSALQFVEQVLAQAESNGDLAEAAECCFNLAVAHYWMAEITRSHAASAHRLALAERCQQPHHLRTAYSWQVLLFASQGLWTEAERVISLARPIVDALSDPVPAAFLRQFCGFLAYQREDYMTAECELQDAQLDQSFQSGLGDLMFYLGLLGLVQAAMGKVQEAQAYLARVKAQLTLLPTDILPTAPLLICVALTAITLGEYERGMRLYPALLAFGGQHYWFLVDRVLGMLAIHGGQWEAAAGHLAAAEATARREGLRPELARTLVAQADLEEARGGQGSTIRARQRLQQALALFEELGMADSMGQVRRRLRALAHQRRDPLASPLPANLTEREAAVLRLVVQGKSNGQIAQELGLSEKTVINHLTHIFNKTACDNRAAAAAFAIRHCLA
ncbi:MAG: AAA family ATPase [Ktedonobacteraceae bacterium]